MRKFTKRVVSTFITGMLVCGMAAGAPVASVYADEGEEEVEISTETDALLYEDQIYYVDSGTYDNFEYQILSNDEVELIGLVDYTVTSITFPSEIEGFPVTSIRGGCIHDCENLEEVFIPKTITYMIPFSGCDNLDKIVVEEGNPVFDSRDNCNAMIETATNTLFMGGKSAVIPYSVTSIGQSAFSSRDMDEIIIPSSVTNIEAGAFAGSKLSKITIPNSVKSIGEGAFVFSEIAEIDISNGVKNIEHDAFYGCDRLTEIYIPASVTYIGTGAFDTWSLTRIEVDEDNPAYDSRENCNAIISKDNDELTCGCSTTVIPSSVKSIGDMAFMGYAGLSSIDIPEGVTTIGSQAFWGCYNLYEVTLSDSVTSIELGAFTRCMKLSQISIPQSVTSISTGAFAECGENFVVFGISGSYAEQYANDVKIAFAPIDYIGFIKSDDDWLYVKNGSKTNDLTGPVSGTIDGTKAWYYVKNGKVDFDFKDFAKVGSSWMYFSNGKVDKTINADHYGSFWGTIDGKGGWYVVKAGKAYPDYNGFALVGSSWMQYKNGQVDKSYTGTLNVNINGTKKWYYINKGKAILDYTGFGKVGSSWMRFKNGEINKTVTGIISGTVNGTKAQWYVKSGKVQLTYSGTYKKNGKTYTIKNGKVTKVS